jgi:hypothetical protein
MTWEIARMTWVIAQTIRGITRMTREIAQMVREIVRMTRVITQTVREIVRMTRVITQTVREIVRVTREIAQTIREISDAPEMKQARIYRACKIIEVIFGFSCCSISGARYGLPGFIFYSGGMQCLDVLPLILPITPVGFQAGKILRTVSFMSSA